jgi:hypothetical protein
LRPFDLGQTQARLDRDDDIGRDAILQVENLGDFAVEAVGLPVRARRGLE